jgi:hypothetical protein
MRPADVASQRIEDSMLDCPVQVEAAWVVSTD